MINAFPRRQSVFPSPEPPFAGPRAPAQSDGAVPVKPPPVVVPRLAPSTTTTVAASG